MKKYVIVCILITIFFVLIFWTVRSIMVHSPITITLTGDVMLGRMVNQVIKQTSYDYPWGNLLSDLQEKDLVLINLETTLTHASRVTPKVFNFKADPDVIQSLQLAGIDVVSLANNHSLDFGIEGLKETLAVLNEAGIYHVGAGMNIAQAQQPVILERKDLRIGILGYTDNEPGWRATSEKPGINYISISDDNSAVFDAARKLKQQVDICIVTLHWGPNMQEYPSQEFVNFSHKLVDAGADIIHGHSAHIVQGIEIYKQKIILYDTGDFVDDYMVTPALRNDLSFLFTIEVENKQLKRLTLQPVLISDMQVNKAADAEAQIIIDMIKKRSLPFNTIFEQSNTTLTIHL